MPFFFRSNTNNAQYCFESVNGLEFSDYGTQVIDTDICIAFFRSHGANVTVVKKDESNYLIEPSTYLSLTSAPYEIKKEDAGNKYSVSFNGFPKSKGVYALNGEVLYSKDELDEYVANNREKFYLQSAREALSQQTKEIDAQLHERCWDLGCRIS